MLILHKHLWLVTCQCHLVYPVMSSGPCAQEEIVSASLSMRKLRKFHALVFVSEEFCFVRCICIFYLCRWHLSNSYWAWLLAGRGLNLISACAAIMMTFLLRVSVCKFFQGIAMRIGCWWYKFSWHCLLSKSCPNPPKALYELHHVQRQAVACPQSSVFWNCAFASRREHLPKRKNKESLSSEHTPPKLEVGLRRTKWGSTLTVCSCSCTWN